MPRFTYCHFLFNEIIHIFITFSVTWYFISTSFPNFNIIYIWWAEKYKSTLIYN